MQIVDFPMQRLKFYLGWGRIINMASMNGLSAQPGKIPYCTTKAGLIGMTRVRILHTLTYFIQNRYKVGLGVLPQNSER